MCLFLGIAVLLDLKMILIKLQIDLMTFSIPTENIITDDILCNEKRLHSKMVKVMCSSDRVTITFFHMISALQFTVQTLAG